MRLEQGRPGFLAANEGEQMCQVIDLAVPEAGCRDKRRGKDTKTTANVTDTWA